MVRPGAKPLVDVNGCFVSRPGRFGPNRQDDGPRFDNRRRTPNGHDAVVAQGEKPVNFDCIRQAIAGLRPGRHRVLTGVLLLMAMSWGNAAWAVFLTNCTPRIYTISPAISGVVYVPQIVGTTLYTGTVSTSFTCDVSETSAGYVLGGNIGSTTFVRNSGKTLGLRTVPGSQTFTFVTVAGAPCRILGTSLSLNYKQTQTYVQANLAGTPGSSRCTVNYSFDFKITVVATPTVDVDFPPDSGPTDSTTQSPTCTFVFTSFCNWLIQANNNEADINLPNSGGTFAARFVRVTCTLSTPNTTVALNPASTTDLAVAGSTSERQAFTINLTGCGALASPYTVNSTWTYTPDAGMATMIANSASSPAANVGVQLLDDLDNVIPNNGVVPLATVATAGSYSKTFKAQYVSKGAAGAGAVTGITQFTMSYQ